MDAKQEVGEKEMEEESIPAAQPQKRTSRRASRVQNTQNMKTETQPQKESFLGEKYIYVKYFLGPQRRPVWTRVLNIEYFKRLIIARRMMSFKFIIDPVIHTRTKTPGPFDWWDQILAHKKSGEIRKKYRGSGIIKRNKTVQEMNVHRELLKRMREKTEIPEKKLENVELKMSFSDTMDFSDKRNCEDKIRAPFETSFEAANKKHRWRVMAQNQINKKRNIAGLKKAVDKEYATEEEEMLDSAKKAKKILYSEASKETIFNYRMAEMDPSRSHSQLSIPTIFQMFAITLRHGIFTNDWALVSKCCEALTEHAATTAYRKGPSEWAIWNGALLALINIYKNDNSILFKTARLMPKILRTYPRRIGIDIATWLTQKGDFLQATQYLEEEHEKHPCPSIFLTSYFQNDKIARIDFVAELFTTAKQYATYKLNFQHYSEGSGLGDTAVMYREGEFVLSLFELLERRGEAIGNDCTIFIDPFMEMCISLRGREEAKEIFERICRKNPDNGILTELYLNFLLQNFPDSTDEMQAPREKLKRFDFYFSYPKKKIEQARYNRHVRKLPKVCSFKRLENPPFSWS